MARTSFPGFPQEGLDFFRGLERHNNRDWFQARKQIFDDHVKRPMYELVEALNQGLAAFAPEYVTPPERAVYRIYRDTRFSKDKTPYKNHIAASFSRQGAPKNGQGGYYFSVSNKEIEVGGGIYLPQPDVLRAIRQYIAANHEELRAIVKKAPVKKLLGDLQGDQLTRVPKGFPPDHPAGDLLRFKYFVLFTTLPAEIAPTKRLYAELLKRFEAMQPFIEYFHRAITRPKAQQRRPKSGHFDDKKLPVAF